MRNRLWVIVLMGGMLNGCQRKDDGLNGAIGLAYYPMEGGRTWTYQVDSVLYDDFYDVTDTVSFQLKEVVQDSFEDNTGTMSYVLYRYARADEADEWRFLNACTAQLEDDLAIRQEGNARMIKLRFPVSGLTRWDGNAYIDLDSVYFVRGASINVYKDWGLFDYQNIHEPMTLGTFDFDSTVTVEQVNAENAIELRYSIEVYAQNVGLVYKEMKILDTQCAQFPNGLADCAGLPWEQKAEKGFILKMTLLEYQ